DPWKICSLIVCPTHYSLKIAAQYGFKNICYLPWTMNISQLPHRTVTGPARLFVHNAGLIDKDDRKATGDTILAFKKVKRKDVRLIVRAQKKQPLPELDDRIEIRFGNLSSPASLYETG